MSDFYSEWLPLIIFVGIIIYFVWKKRKEIEIQNFIPYVFYFILYRTKLGLKFMKDFSRKHRTFVHWYGYIAIAVGFSAMIYTSYIIIVYSYMLIAHPATTPVGPSIVMPFKAKGVLYVPFFYWLISLFLLMIFHESSHGIVASSHKIKIKSSGFAILAILVPILPAAFVEPDDKQLEKKKAYQRISVYAAGPFANIVLGFLSILLLIFVLNPLIIQAAHVSNINANIWNGGALTIPSQLKILKYYSPDNVTSPLKLAGVPVNSTIIKINNISIESKKYDFNRTNTLKAIIKNDHPGSVINITLNNSKVYQVKLAKKLGTDNSTFLGGFFSESKPLGNYPYSWLINPIYIFVFWFMLLNLGIGLFNLLPMGSKSTGLMLDGGFMFEALTSSLFKKKKNVGKFIYSSVSWFFLFLIVFVVLSPWIF